MKIPAAIEEKQKIGNPAQICIVDEAEGQHVGVGEEARRRKIVRRILREQVRMDWIMNRGID